MHTDGHRIKNITEKIIGCAMEVPNTIGAGFTEKIYHNAMIVELKHIGICF